MRTSEATRPEGMAQGGMGGGRGPCAAGETRGSCAVRSRRIQRAVARLGKGGGARA